MGKTVLQLVQAAAYEANMTSVPSTLISVTDFSTLQLINLFYATTRDLHDLTFWPQLKKSYTVNLESQRTQYPLPQDFYAGIPQTYWDQGNKWEMLGPLSDRDWDYRLYGYITIENRVAFRVFGPDANPNSSRGQLYVNPTPGDAQAGLTLTFEYLTSSTLLPPNWAASTSYAQNDYVNSNGNIYKKTDSGSDTSGTVSPNMAYGQGQDGGVYWTALTVTAWGALTYYAAGAYVTNGGLLYVATTGGKSASSGGPTGTSTSITDGTVVWDNLTIGSWVGQTEYEFGDVILISAQYYRASTPGTQGNNTQKTGSNQPTWTTTTVIDNTITWTFQPQTYETIITNNDLCLFDDDLMILGLKWRFLQARGCEYQDLKKEYDDAKDSAVARWNMGQVLNMSQSGSVLIGYPNIPEGNYGG